MQLIYFVICGLNVTFHVEQGVCSVYSILHKATTDLT